MTTKKKRKMILPIRCFTCNNILGHYFHIKEYNQEVFDHFNIKRSCCKKILLHSIDIHEDLQDPLKSEHFQIKKELENKRLVIPQ